MLNRIARLMLATGALRLPRVIGCLLAMSLALGRTAAGQEWTTSGANIYNANTGNVGVGTATPASKLFVIGTFSAAFSDTIYSPIYTASDGTLVLNGSSNVALQTGAVTHLLVTGSNGNVSVNTALGGGIYRSDGQTDLQLYRDSDIGDWSLLRSNIGNGIAIIGQPDVPALAVSRTTSNVGIGMMPSTHRLQVVGNTRSTRFSNTDTASAVMEMRGSGAGAENLVFGHLNPNYPNSIGAFEPSGHPFIAFFGRHSSTPNTLKRTAGGFGVGVLTADLAGNVSVQAAPAGAAGSDAALTTVATFSSGATKLQVFGDATFAGKVTGTNIQAQYQDVAEWVPVRQRLAPGTVVVLNPEIGREVRASSTSYDTTVAGVVSASPGVLLGEAGDGKAMIATTGRVKVKADATSASIRVGDLLVTSELEGCAMRSEPIDVAGSKIHRAGTLIGKALEPLEKGQRGEILILLSLQ